MRWSRRSCLEIIGWLWSCILCSWEVNICDCLRIKYAHVPTWINKAGQSHLRYSRILTVSNSNFLSTDEREEKKEEVLILFCDINFHIRNFKILDIISIDIISISIHHHIFFRFFNWFFSLRILCFC